MAAVRMRSRAGCATGYADKRDETRVTYADLRRHSRPRSDDAPASSA